MFGPFKKNNEEHIERNGDDNVQEACRKCSNGDSDVTSGVDVANLEKKIDACELELSQTKDQFVRLGADFHNYKKRVEKDRLAWMQSMQASFFGQLLSIVNDFDRALELEVAKVPSDASLVDQRLSQTLAGFVMIRKSLGDFLKRNNVEPIVQIVTFDPELHEALMHVDATGFESGAIVTVLEPGYTLNGTVIKPAKVSVAK